MTNHNPELSQEPEANLDSHQKSMKEFENGAKDGSALSGFGKMLQGFIDRKTDRNNSQNKDRVDNLKKDTIIEASRILNNSDPTATTEQKIQALEDLFKKFQDNKEAFPQEQNLSQQDKKSESDASEKFVDNLMKSIEQHRIDSQERNANFRKELPDQGNPPCNNPESVRSCQLALDNQLSTLA